MRHLALLLLVFACDDVAPTPDAAPVADAGVPDADLVRYTQPREPCADRNPLRNLYWGDLHVHTALSFDAWVFDIRTTPEEAYAFAKGAPLRVPPLDPEGRGTQEVRLARPLDFAAVTDHSEYLAEIAACTDPASPAYGRETCISYRDGDQVSIFAFGSRLTNELPQRFEELCGDAIECPGAVRDVWSRVQDAANTADDPSAACRFTAFVAYEYSAATRISNLHRNVVFRNGTVPDLPVSYFDERTPEGLWARLDEDCVDAETGCEVLAIPHNSNWSNGNLFALPEGSAEERRAWAERRARLEPLVEVVQHKGDSECANGFAAAIGGADELCDFEKLRGLDRGDCGEGTGGGAMAGLGCLSAYDFVRNALKRGLRIWDELGVDPFHLGLMASTDTHSATPGAVAERGWKGHWGNNEDTPERRLARGTVTPGGVLNNPGGLIAVWSVENSRDALFEAMKRREVYGTSGPRMAVRLFAGRGLASDLCDAPDLLERGYAEGVPMGSDLPPGGSAPTLVVHALQDPDGAPLQRIQVVKGWIDADGGLAERVVDIAGGPNDAGVDPATCALTGEGHAELCAAWTDPDFDPARPAFYYARVVENPTCRWSTWECVDAPAGERPTACETIGTPDGPPRTIQERAWTSPVWHLPER